MRVVGVDGRPGGWVAVALEDGTAADVRELTRLADALALGAEVVAVDIPLGLPDRPPRAADVAARRFLGRRACCVFPTFPRPAYAAGDYAAARELCRSEGWPVLSAQSYALRRKLLEADAVRGDPRLVEVHPEVTFAALAGEPLESKRSPAGLARRRRLLAGQGIEVEPDADVLDAAAAAWSAARYARDEAVSLPAGHECRLGAIWY